MPTAASLAAELKTAFDTAATLIPGGEGIFDVTANGSLIFSKHDCGRFPNKGEIVGLLQQ